MGILDSISSTINKGTAAAERTGKKAQLKLQLNDINKQRQDLAAQLGASIFETVKNDPELLKGRESVVDAISALDDQRAAIEAQLAQIEEEARSAQIAAAILICTKCHGQVRPTDAFCSGCGKSVSEIIQETQAAQTVAQAQAASQPYEVHADSGDSQAQDTDSKAMSVCPSCGASAKSDSLFCEQCGTKL